ncbi:MAG TPA: ATP-grasp domain-containing protein [Candidatus Hydrogenedentes bacterium]|nr:ATP-grasp domain-containing protein [Candidatus Hydrogenedentota bacterium]HOR50348.1 ATP-grasp domain-containing protein [Candidatus Hydrogenedentota bacterium]
MTSSHASSARLTLLVLAVGGNVSQGILKALKRSSLSCRIIGTDLSELQMGLYTVDRGVLAPHASEPGFEEWLVDLCLKEDVDAVLSGCEPVLRVLAEIRERVESRTKAKCIVCSPEIWCRFDDKLLGCAWLKEQGFDYPDFAAMEDDAEVERLVSGHGYPLLAKPRIGGGSTGIVRVGDDADLAYVRKREGYLLQEYLTGKEKEFTIGCFSDRDGYLRGSIVFHRTLLAGTSYRITAGAFPEVRSMAEAIVRRTGITGPCNLQFRLTERGPVCFEVNPRFSGTTPIRAAFGFNEVEAALRHFVLGEEGIDLPDVTEGIALRYWNELYVPVEARDQLLAEGSIDPSVFPGIITEPYGGI